MLVNEWKNKIVNSSAFTWWMFLINGSANLGNNELPKSIEDEFKAMIKGGKAALKVRLSHAKAEGPLSDSSETNYLATFFNVYFCRTFCVGQD